MPVPRFTLHGIWMSGPTYKVGLMLSLCGEQFDYVQVDMMNGAHKSPEYKILNPFGIVPTLHDARTQLCYRQSAAILEHIADETGKLKGANAQERQTAREWVLWGWDRLAAGIYRPRIAKLGFRKMPAEVVEHYKADGLMALKDLDAWLSAHTWIAGSNPTFADADLYGVICYAPQGDVSLAEVPHVTAWMKRVEALPGFKGPNDLLPKESRKAA